MRLRARKEKRRGCRRFLCFIRAWQRLLPLALRRQAIVFGTGIYGFLGFGDVASTATGISKILFFLFLVMFLVTTIASLFA